MIPDAILILRVLFVDILKLFNCFRIPGTFTTPLGWIMFSMVFVVVLKVIKRFLGFGGDDDGPSDFGSGVPRLPKH